MASLVTKREVTKFFVIVKLYHLVDKHVVSIIP